MTQSNTPSNDPTTADDRLGDPSDTLGGPQGDTTRKDPEEWVTGDEPMTGAQRSYLDTLAREAGEELPEDSGRRSRELAGVGEGSSPGLEGSSLMFTPLNLGS